jgi:hypothetical protein
VERLAGKSGIDAACRPQFASRLENVLVHWHEGMKVIDRYGIRVFGYLGLIMGFAVYLLSMCFQKNTLSRVSKAAVEVFGER